jgi:membrane protein
VWNDQSRGWILAIRGIASRLWWHVSPSLRYLFSTEVHAYAFSIAANAYLSFFPFVILLLTTFKRWLHWQGAYQVVIQLLDANLPLGSNSMIRTLEALAAGKQRLQWVSAGMLLFTSSGVFLPLEVALNKVWGFPVNRSFVRNQLVSFLLALAAGVLALLSILLTAAAQWVVNTGLFWFPNASMKTVALRAVLEIVSIPLLVSIHFMIYYFLPNGKVPLARVLPAALVAGVLTEIGKFVYFLTLPMFRFREVYGTFTLSVAMVFWAFLGSLILLFGANLSVQRFWDARPGALRARHTEIEARNAAFFHPAKVRSNEP